MKYWYVVQHGWTLKHYAKGKKLNTKGHIFYNFIYIKCPELTHSESERKIIGKIITWCRSGEGGNEEWLLMDTEFLGG